MKSNLAQCKRSIKNNNQHYLRIEKKAKWNEMSYQNIYNTKSSKVEELTAKFQISRHVTENQAQYVNKEDDNISKKSSKQDIKKSHKMSKVKEGQLLALQVVVRTSQRYRTHAHKEDMRQKYPGGPNQAETITQYCTLYLCQNITLNINRCIGRIRLPNGVEKMKTIKSEKQQWLAKVANEENITFIAS